MSHLDFKKKEATDVKCGSTPDPTLGDPPPLKKGTLGPGCAEKRRSLSFIQTLREIPQRLLEVLSLVPARNVLWNFTAGVFLPPVFSHQLIQKTLTEYVRHTGHLESSDD